MVWLLKQTHKVFYFHQVNETRWTVDGLAHKKRVNTLHFAQKI
jgi:hypothetical protein